LAYSVQFCADTHCYAWRTAFQLWCPPNVHNLELQAESSRASAPDRAITHTANRIEGMSNQNNSYLLLTVVIKISSKISYQHHHHRPAQKMTDKPS
jgi:hypothetical protein